MFGVDLPLSILEQDTLFLRVLDMYHHISRKAWPASNTVLQISLTSLVFWTHFLMKLTHFGVSLDFHHIIFYYHAVINIFIQKQCRRKKKKQNLHPWVKVDQAIKPLPPKTLSILVGLAWTTDISVQSQLTRLETSGRFGLF